MHALELSSGFVCVYTIRQTFIHGRGSERIYSVALAFYSGIPARITCMLLYVVLCAASMLILSQKMTHFFSAPVGLRQWPERAVTVVMLSSSFIMVGSGSYDVGCNMQCVIVLLHLLY